MSGTDYEVVEAIAQRDREEILALWDGILGHRTRLTAKYDWFYLDCPGNAPLVMTLLHRPGGDRVGVVAAGERRMLWRGAAVRAALMVDLAVAPEHRWLGPALILQRRMKQTAAERFDLLYVFPNPLATPVYLRAGYAQLGEIVRHARVLRHRRYVARHLPEPLAWAAGALLDTLDAVRRRLRTRPCRHAWTDRCNDEMEQLWATSPHGDGPVTIRDRAYLEWRFDRSPLVRTRYLLLRGDDGRLEAWFACQARDDDILQVHDFWSVDAVEGLSRSRVDTVLHAARAAGHRAVWFEFAGAPRAVAGWREAGFKPRSRRPVFGHSTACPPQTLAASLHLTAADEDE